MQKYKIEADCKSYSRWEVDEKGELVCEIHEFEGQDIINYGIVDVSNDSESDDFIIECDTFEKAQRELENLLTPKMQEFEYVVLKNKNILTITN